MEFLETIKQVDLSFYQEREVGLDIYLSGVWGWVPVALAVVSGSIFFLAIFHIVPLRRHSIPLLLFTGFVALAVGLIGTYLNFSKFLQTTDGPVPEIFERGTGRQPQSDSDRVTLLSLPLLLGVLVIAESLGWSLFLLIFGSKESSQEGKGTKTKKRKSKKDDGNTESP